ncbi:MAG: hypothetical protein ACREU5_03865 [Burkholderiales bacterium]
MREILGVTQDSPLTRRRWFHDDYFDLFVAQASGGALRGFQLCYGLNSGERALVWELERGYFHDGVHPLKPQTIARRFEAVAHGLPGEVARAVGKRLREYAAQGEPAPARRKRFRRAEWQQQA